MTLTRSSMLRSLTCSLPRATRSPEHTRNNQAGRKSGRLCVFRFEQWTGETESALAMMQDAGDLITDLIFQGNQFTYENFTSSRTAYGYPESLSADFLVWRSDVISLILQTCRPGSSPHVLLEAAGAVAVMRNGSDKFHSMMEFYKKALGKTQKLSESDWFAERLHPDEGSDVLPTLPSNRVFIVHGHDDKSKQELEILLTEMGLEPVVLHRQIDSGRTIIEKFEHHSDVGYAFVLLTPDEIAYLVSDDPKPDDQRLKERRARPNVIFELGFFVGRLGRSKTCCLYRGDVTVPGDLGGIVYKKFNTSVEEVAYSIQKELKGAGYLLK